MHRPLPTTDAEAEARIRAAVLACGPDHHAEQYRHLRDNTLSLANSFCTVMDQAIGCGNHEPEPATPERPATEGQVCLLATSLHRLLLSLDEYRKRIPGGFTTEAFEAMLHRRVYAIEQAREALRACQWVPPGEEAPPHDDPLCFDVECLG